MRLSNIFGFSLITAGILASGENQIDKSKLPSDRKEKHQKDESLSLMDYNPSWLEDYEVSNSEETLSLLLSKVKDSLLHVNGAERDIVVMKGVLYLYQYTTHRLMLGHKVDFKLCYKLQYLLSFLMNDKLKFALSSLRFENDKVFSTYYAVQKSYAKAVPNRAGLVNPYKADFIEKELNHINMDVGTLNGDEYDTDIFVHYQTIYKHKCLNTLDSFEKVSSLSALEVIEIDDKQWSSCFGILVITAPDADAHIQIGEKSVVSNEILRYNDHLSTIQSPLFKVSLYDKRKIKKFGSKGDRLWVSVWKDTIRIGSNWTDTYLEAYGGKKAYEWYRNGVLKDYYIHDHRLYVCLRKKTYNEPSFVYLIKSLTEFEKIRFDMRYVERSYQLQ